MAKHLGTDVALSQANVRTVRRLVHLYVDGMKCCVILVTVVRPFGNTGLAVSAQNLISSITSWIAEVECIEW